MTSNRLVTLAAGAFVLSAPGLASATSLWHYGNGDAEESYHPEHLISTKTRAEVLQELEAARKDGTLWYLQHGLPVPIKAVGTGRTRAEVQREVLNMTAAERRPWETTARP
ncbi:MAG: DUF4148 domain-containing protein [Burkholderiaceae bacterium]